MSSRAALSARVRGEGRREGRNAQAAAALLGPATFIVVLVMIAPLALLARYSLDRFDPTQLMIETVTPANYARFFTDPFYVNAMRTTITVAVSTTAFCLVLALPLAWRIARSTSRWKSTYMLLVILPLFIGSTVRSVGWMILFARGGMMDSVGQRLFGWHVDLMYTAIAVVFGIVSINLPIMVLTLQSVFEGIDSRLEEAARGLGAAPARAFFRVVWPLALPGVGIAAILCFILAMNAYATPVLLGGPRFQMMAPLLYWEFASNNNWPFAGALAFILMGTTLLLTTLSNTVIPRRYRA
jgi:putative spermidine/putrescine transport system permease protein